MVQVQTSPPAYCPPLSSSQQGQLGPFPPSPSTCYNQPKSWGVKRNGSELSFRRDPAHFREPSCQLASTVLSSHTVSPPCSQACHLATSITGDRAGPQLPRGTQGMLNPCKQPKKPRSKCRSGAGLGPAQSLRKCSVRLWLRHSGSLHA